MPASTCVARLSLPARLTPTAAGGPFRSFSEENIPPVTPKTTTANSLLAPEPWPGKRAFDVAVVVCALPVAAIVFAVVAMAIKLTSKGPVLYWSARVGRNNRNFRMPKFRSMRIDTPQVATHLLTNPDAYVTAVGRLLRKTSLDELPQLISVLKGDLSLVGPRPALFNQDDLVALRTRLGVHKLVPGITGWAQINGRDELPIPIKVEYDAEYLRKQSFWFDLKILFLTVFKVVRREGIQH